MTWIKIDDSFPDHPKIISLSDLAFRLHIHALCYCGKFLTDGFISYQWVNMRLRDDEAIEKPTDELEEMGLWIREEKGWQIHDYLTHQTSKEQVAVKRASLRERQKRYREKHAVSDNNAEPVDDYWNNALITRPEYRIQNTEDRIQNTEVTTSTSTNLEIVKTDNDSEILFIGEEKSAKADSSGLAITSLQKPIAETFTPVPYLTPSPRVKSAAKAVERVSLRLEEARKNGINAWNLSRLIEDEWDVLHNANDNGGCIALTVWYVSELQSRELSSSDIARIGQMTKRFGRIALLAIDEAATKDLNDLVSYAFRIAQNLYKEKAER
jgi:hypothetical protein